MLIPIEITSPIMAKANNTAKAITAPSLSPELPLLLILSDEQPPSSLLVSLKQLADATLKIIT